MIDFDIVVSNASNSIFSLSRSRSLHRKEYLLRIGLQAANLKSTACRRGTLLYVLLMPTSCNI